MAKDDKRMEKEQLDAQWKTMIYKYEHAVGSWEKACQQLRAQGVLVKNLPKKPKHPLKPKLKELEGETAGNGADDEEIEKEDAN